ncbi:hypothetical protein WJX72_001548 [[Myrmecia] bisecta]|uniref:Uncharacterized protein n=1 Tax=[Myrmecia] bisecta TaxID=41462 RepID=A0AAW1PGL8_9CHLO
MHYYWLNLANLAAIRFTGRIARSRAGSARRRRGCSIELPALEHGCSPLREAASLCGAAAAPAGRPAGQCAEAPSGAMRVRACSAELPAIEHARSQLPEGES